MAFHIFRILLCLFASLSQMAKKDKTRQDKTSSTLCRLISCCVCVLFSMCCHGRLFDAALGGGRIAGEENIRQEASWTVCPTPYPTTQSNRNTTQPQHNHIHPHLNTTPHSKTQHAKENSKGKEFNCQNKRDCLILANSVSNEPLQK